MKRSRTIKNKVYKFVHRQDVQIKTTIIDRIYENSWLNIMPDGTIIIKASENNYAWDGCSPKFNWLDLVIGTPDGRLDFNTEKPITYYASMFHDILYQFKEDIPITRKEADLLFFELLKQSNFFWSDVYYIMVRLFGGIYGKWKTKNGYDNIIICYDSWS